MLLPGHYKGNRRRLFYRPRTLEEIMGEQFKLDPKLLCFGERKQMPDRSKYFQGGNFLKPKDVKDGQLVTIEEFSDAKTRIGTRPILRLVGIEMPFGLNATNFDTMVEKFGENEKNWKGKKIRLRFVQAPNPSNGGKMQTAIRIE